MFWSKLFNIPVSSPIGLQIPYLDSGNSSVRTAQSCHYGLTEILHVNCSTHLQEKQVFHRAGADILATYVDVHLALIKLGDS